MRAFVIRRIRSVGTFQSTRRDLLRRYHHPSAACHSNCSSLQFSFHNSSFLIQTVRKKRLWTSSCRCFGTSRSPPSDDNEETTTPTSKQELIEIWLQQLKSPPNLITLSRILSTPVLSYFIISNHYDWALYGCAAAGLTDFLDGFLAKRYNMNTVLGTYLDPLADKILINVLSISLWYSDILPTPLIVLWFGRDVALMGATYLLVKSETKSDGRFVVDPVNTPLKVEPTNISKINTVFQFLTLGVGMLQPVYGVPPGLLETLW